MSSEHRFSDISIIVVALSIVASAHAQTPGRLAEYREIHTAQMSVPDARKFFNCATRMSFSQGHGTQVSYLRPDGAVFLWYPGNTVVLQGQWKIEERTGASQPPGTYAALCFQYGANTYNPVTKQRGSQWECQPAHLWARVTVERVDGDMFGLANRSAVPFRLSRERTTIADLQQNLRSQVPNAERRIAPDPGCAAEVAHLAGTDEGP